MFDSRFMNLDLDCGPFAQNVVEDGISILSQWISNSVYTCRKDESDIVDATSCPDHLSIHAISEFKDRLGQYSLVLEEIEFQMLRLSSLHGRLTSNKAKIVSFLSSPIKKLPTELLEVVLFSTLPPFGYICGFPTAPGWGNSFSTVSSLSLVCKEWRTTLNRSGTLNTRLTYASYISPTPKGPWNSDVDYRPWFLPEEGDIGYKHHTNMGHCVPETCGPASTFDDFFAQRAVVSATRTKNQILDIDMRGTACTESGLQALVDLAPFCAQWGSLVTDNFSLNAARHLRTIANGDVDIAFPFVESEEEDTVELQKRLSDRLSGLSAQNKLRELHTVWLRRTNSKGEPGRYNQPYFLQGLEKLIHLSTSHLFKFISPSFDQHFRSHWAQLITLELSPVHRWDHIAHILSHTTSVQNLILCLTKPNGFQSIRGQCIEMPSVLNLVYYCPGDINLEFLTVFRFPSLRVLSFGVSKRHAANGSRWLTSRVAELTVMRAILGIGRRNKWPDLQTLELLDLLKEEIRKVEHDFDNHAGTLKIRNKLKDIAVLGKGDKGLVKLEDKFWEFSSVSRISSIY